MVSKGNDVYYIKDKQLPDDQGASVEISKMLNLEMTSLYQGEVPVNTDKLGWRGILVEVIDKEKPSVLAADLPEMATAVSTQLFSESLSSLLAQMSEMQKTPLVKAAIAILEGLRDQAMATSNPNSQKIRYAKGIAALIFFYINTRFMHLIQQNPSHQKAYAAAALVSLLITAAFALSAVLGSKRAIDFKKRAQELIFEIGNNRDDIISYLYDTAARDSGWTDLRNLNERELLSRFSDSVGKLIEPTGENVESRITDGELVIEMRDLKERSDHMITMLDKMNARLAAAAQASLSRTRLRQTAAQKISGAYTKAKQVVQGLRKPKSNLREMPKRGDRAQLIEPLRGGIDLNSANLDLQIIKRNGKGIPLPLAQQDMAQMSRIQGFIPQIIEIRPALNIPIISELQQKLQSS